MAEFCEKNGGKVVLFEHYQYVKVRQYKSGVWYCRCTNYKKLKCAGSVNVKMSDDDGGSDFNPPDGGPGPDNNAPQDNNWSWPAENEVEDTSTAPTTMPEQNGIVNTLGLGMMGAAIGGALGQLGQGGQTTQGNQPAQGAQTTQGKQPNDPYGYTVPEHGYKPGQGYGPGFGVPDQYSQAGSDDKSTQSNRPRPDGYHHYPSHHPFGYPFNSYPNHDTTRSMGQPQEQEGWRQKLALAAKVAFVVCFAALCCLNASN